MTYEKILMDGTAVDRTLSRLAHQILECNDNVNEICLIGILRKGAPLAKILAEKIKQFSGVYPLLGELDISCHRDDVKDSRCESKTNIPFDVVGKTVILTDDVIFTGRTTRAAMDAVINIGRPAKIQLAVLIDRGHRELPIRGDYVGKNIPTSKSERILVKLSDGSSEPSVVLVSDK